MKKNVELGIKIDKKWTGMIKEPHRHDKYEKIGWNTADTYKFKHRIDMGHVMTKTTA